MNGKEILNRRLPQLKSSEVRPSQSREDTHPRPWHQSNAVYNMDMQYSDYVTDLSQKIPKNKMKSPKKVLGYQLDAVRPMRADSIPSDQYFVKKTSSFFKEDDKKKLAKSLIQNAEIQKRETSKKSAHNSSIDGGLDAILSKPVKKKTLHVHPLTKELTD